MIRGARGSYYCIPLTLDVIGEIFAMPALDALVHVCMVCVRVCVHVCA